MINKKDPFDILIAMHKNAMAIVNKRPVCTPNESNWIGVATMVGEQPFLMPLQELVAILSLHKLWTVPLTKYWLRGIINYRGAILPVTDLSCFFTGNRINLDKKTRILVVPFQGDFIGLLVSQVLEIFRFSLDKKKDLSSIVNNSYKPFVYHEYEKKEKVWPVFSISSFVKDLKLQQVTANMLTKEKGS